MHPFPARPRPCSTSLRRRTPRWPWTQLGSARSRRRLAKAGSVSDYQYLVRESLDGGSIVRVFLNRPDARNAQNRGMLVELDDALISAEANDEVRVIILGGLGPIFSSGHDLGSRVQQEELALGPKQHPTRKIHGGTRLGTEQRMLQEWHYYFDNTRRWRNLGKITIAQVHGNVLAAGLMLMWACDLIVAAEGTTFADVVGTRLGMCGLEYFGHPWEFGPRRAKELLLTGDSLDVEEAYRIGMVSKVYPEKQLADSTLEFARRIAKLPTVAALLIKQSVNQSVDQMGFYNALNSCFSLHQINHAHWAEVTGGASAGGTPEFGVPAWRNAPAVRPSARS
jgi:enoyl-CoA hydratase